MQPIAYAPTLERINTSHHPSSTALPWRLALSAALCLAVSACGSSKRSDETPTGSAGAGHTGVGGIGGSGGSAGSLPTDGGSGGGSGAAGTASGGGSGAAGTASGGSSGSGSGIAGSAGSGSSVAGSAGTSSVGGQGPTQGLACSGTDACVAGERCVACSTAEGSHWTCAPHPDEDPSGYEAATSKCDSVIRYNECDGPEDCPDGRYCANTSGNGDGPGSRCLAEEDLPFPMPCCYTCGALPECTLCWNDLDCPDSLRCFPNADAPGGIGDCRMPT